MGYDPPPPMRRPERIRCGTHHVARGWRWPSRRTIDDVPDPDNDGPHAVHMRVEPDGDRWTWRVWFTFDGHESWVEYSTSSWRKPSPYEVRGRCRDQGKADERARACADDARARYVARTFNEIRRASSGHTDRLPL